MASTIRDLQTPKKRAKRKDRLLHETAHHEAGHTIASFHLFLPFRYVIIEPDPGQSLGHVRHPKLPKAILEDLELSRGECELRTQRWVQNQIISSMAGAIAQERFLIEEGRLPKRTIRRKVQQGSGANDP